MPFSGRWQEPNSPEKGEPPPMSPRSTTNQLPQPWQVLKTTRLLA